MAIKSSRTWISFGAGGLVAIALAYAFWPRPVMVDMGEAARLPMRVIIEEEARTQVRNAYVVSTPIEGRLLRVVVEPGDVVEQGRTVVAHMLPTNPSALDTRARGQASAVVAAANAALRVARADYKKAVADKELAAVELRRARQLRSSGMIAQANLDVAERAALATVAAQDVAMATIAMREADLANARAQQISYSGSSAMTTPSLGRGNGIPLTAPISGKVLRIVQKSETTLSAGAPIMEIGDTSNDLEVVAELLSTDAIQVAVGNPVVIDNWGGAAPLHGVVERIEPWGFTKPSALGVEEQRVNTIIRFTDKPAQRSGLGHGYRVQAQIIVWEDANALTVPSSALFREKDGWAVFAVERGVARLTPVQVGRNNGLLAQVGGGLDAGTRIVLYPSPSLMDGVRIKQR